MRTFTPNTTDWLVSLPASETIYAGLGTGGTQMARTDFYYDGTTSCSVASTNQLPTQGNLTRVVRWLSGGAPSSWPETRMAYDSMGNVICTRDAKGNQSTMSYDTLSRKTSMHDPDMGDWSYQYDANGNLTLQTDAKLQQIHFQYDALNRRVQKDYGTQKALGSGDVVYTYGKNKGVTRSRIVLSRKLG